MKLATIRELFDRFASELSLSWDGKGEDRSICSKHPDDAKKPIVGPFNTIRPNLIQIIGPPEFQHLHTLEPSDYRTCLKQLFSSRPAAIIFTDALKPNPECAASAAESNTALMHTPLADFKVIQLLLAYFNQPHCETTIVHGVFMEVLGKGVLLRGDPAVGKSELALELISRGNRLIADDATEFMHLANNMLRGQAPAILQDFLEVRGLGVINVRAMFGDSAIKPSKFLNLIIDLKYLDENQTTQMNRLTGVQSSTSILGIKVSQTTLPVAPGRNLAILVETAVRQYILQAGGYDASDDFSQQQLKLIESQKA